MGRIRLIQFLGFPIATLSVGMGQPCLSVQIRIIDQAAVPDKVLSKGEQDASYILERTGVHIDWLSCPLGDQNPETTALCSRNLGQADFWLHIVNRKLPDLSEDTMGFTVVDPSRGSFAYVFFPRVVEFAKYAAAPIVPVMGAALAHEIGHLLLGEQAHSKRGVMCGRLGPEHFALSSRGGLLFTDDQARRIRAEVSRRRGACAAGR